MFDAPEPDALLASVAELLRTELVTALDGSLAFKAKVAANAIDLVRRQVDQADALDRAENTKLVALLGRNGSTLELNRDLARRIRDGAVESDLPGMTEHMLDTTIAKVMVDQPQYATLALAQAMVSNGTVKDKA